MNEIIKKALAAIIFSTLSVNFVIFSGLPTQNAKIQEFGNYRINNVSVVQLTNTDIQDHPDGLSSYTIKEEAGVMSCTVVSFDNRIKFYFLPKRG